VVEKVLENRFKLAGRGADNTKHFRRSRLLLQRLPQLAKQPRVLNGDDGLVGEGLDQLDLLLCKRPRFLALQSEHANDGTFPDERHAKSTAYIDEPRVIMNSVTVELRVGQKIGNVYRAALEYCTPEDRTLIRLCRITRILIVLF